MKKTVTALTVPLPPLDKKKDDDNSSTLLVYKHIKTALNKYIDYPKKTMGALDPEDLNSDLVGKLTSYFANHANSRCDERFDLLSCTTALGYMAANKTYFNKKHRETNLDLTT